LDEDLGGEVGDTHQFSLVHLAMITQECYISNAEEVCMQVLGPINGR